MECTICNKSAVFKIKGENIYYCKNHAEEFFSTNSLEEIQKLELSEKQAQILKNKLNYN